MAQNAIEPAASGSAQSIKSHALIEIQVSRGDQRWSMSFAVKVAFESATGLGVAFLKPQPKLLKYLVKFSETENDVKPPPDPKPIVNPRRTTLYRILREQNHRFLAEHLPAFFEQASEALLSAINEIGQGSSQADLFYALSTLQKKQSAITKSLAEVQDLDIAAGQAGRTEREIGAQEMALVEKEDFDEWIHIVDLARTTEAKFLELLRPILTVLAQLNGTPVSSDENPLSPQHYLWSLRNVLQPYSLDNSAKKIVYGAFCDQVLSHIGRLYGDLRQTFEHQGVSSTVEKAQPASKRLRSVSQKPTRQRGKRHFLGTLAAMLPGDKREHRATPDNTVSNEQILAVLDQIPLRSSRPMSERLASQLARPGSQSGKAYIADGTASTIDATQRLITALSTDQRLNDNTQQALQRLEIPLIKETLSDPELLENASHPVRRLLDTLDQLAPLQESDSLTGRADRQLNDLLESIVEAASSGDASAIQASVDAMEKLLQERKSRFEQNLALVVSGSEQDDCTTQARQTILQEIDARLPAPHSAAVIRLLQLGWPGLLVQTLASDSAEENDASNYFEALTLIHTAFHPSAEQLDLSREECADLLQTLQLGFEEYPLHQREAADFLEEVQAALRSTGDLRDKLCQPAAKQNLPDLSVLLGQLFPAQLVAENPIAENDHWLQLVARIGHSEWIAEWRDSRQVRLLQLAWKNPAGTRFVFVDGEGKKALDCSATQLAEQFAKQQLSILENRELPLVERAVERMLKQTFSQISHESATDELTGLLNRKAFVKKIDELIEETTTDGAVQGLILLDVDQFTMINEVCGYDGGDRLLQTMVSVISPHLPEQATLARIGDDEFGVLIHRTTLDATFQLAETQRRAVENLKFNWKGQTAPVSTSIGIVIIDNDEQTPAELLGSLASACRLAKQSGRNCSKIYQPLDQAFQEQRRLVKSVPFIEEALANNRLRLSSQLITPLFFGDDKDHHEILLRVLDENDQPTNPEEFIRAAEKYDRMRTVDRWVTERFFAWADENRKAIPEDEGFSLNLSGQSALDERFWDFLEQQLENSWLPPERLGLEITETAMVRNIDRVVSQINRLREKGCSFYLDDFGSGYASYSYLKQLPVDCIKIDGIFVHDMLEEKSSQAMVRSITEVAHFMEKKVVAEYVENEAIIIALRELDVDFAQGYGVGKPISLDELVLAWKSFS